jgi:hypothetical protein
VTMTSRSVGVVMVTVPLCAGMVDIRLRILIG